jgi:exodeoxyribonuclease VII small subunit
MNNNANQQLSFEKAFERLEEILEQMNSGEVSLDASLKLYEEADRLISTCSTKLNDAEQKIETLIKNREGELVLGKDQKPQTQPYSPPSHPLVT